MIEDGVLDGVDHVLGTHVMTNMELVKCSTVLKMFKQVVHTLS